MIRFTFKNSGFTLIELLVVIAIVGILSTILYASFGEARMQARDKTRMTTLKDVQLSLERYKSQNGTYPLAGCGATTAQFAGPGKSTQAGHVSCEGNQNITNYILGLVPEYIGSLPFDAKFDTLDDKGYYYRSDGNDYKLMIKDGVEVIVVTSYNDKFARCPAAVGGPCSGAVPANTYAVYSPGAEAW